MPFIEIIYKIIKTKPLIIARKRYSELIFDGQKHATYNADFSNVAKCTCMFKGISLLSYAKSSNLPFPIPSRFFY